MNNQQWQQVEDQLPEGSRIIRTYTASENGELRVIVMLPAAQHETRYVVHFEGESATVKHKP